MQESVDRERVKEVPNQDCVERLSSCPNPTVSILMSVYNDAGFLAESMESMLTQEGPECEFVIVDDAGTDDSASILDSYTDPRITLIRHQANKGLATSLNDGLRRCRGKYIARQDGDDISEPGRICKQVAYLEKHAELAYAGTGVVIIDEEGNEGRSYLFPEKPEEIREQILELRTPLAHPTLMFRRDALDAIGGYDELFKKSEDFDLHLRLLERFNAGNLRERLVRLRLRRQSMQNGDTSGDCLKFVLFAYSRQQAKQRFGPLTRAAETLLLARITEWFQQGSISRFWTGDIRRRIAFEAFARGRRWQGLGVLALAIAEDPTWLVDFTLHGRRIVLNHSRRKQIDAIIESVIAEPAALPRTAA